MDMDKIAAIGVMDSDEATQAIPAPGANATQMAINVECPVCRTPNPPSETYCIDCGFLLSDMPVTVSGAPEASQIGKLITPDGTREFPLRAGSNSVGRENADILLTHNTVSRRHATIEVEDGRVFVKDAGSTNGTYVDGKKLAPDDNVELKDGSEVVFGSFILQYQAPAEAEDTCSPGGDGQEKDHETPLDVEEAPSPEGESQEEGEDRSDSEESVVGWLAARDGSCKLDIRRGVNTVGRRAADNDIDIPDPYCSGRHADLIVEDGRFTITDIGSTNGTLVNGVRLEANVPRELAAGDEITLGQMTFVLEVRE